MQKDIQRSSERGQSNHGWLQSRFSFNFADYYNPNRTGFGKLLVLNDDTVAVSRGFGAHPHENMEIITVVLNGALAHEDNTGVKEVIKVGDIQVMSAGSGIVHSEYNASSTEDVKLLQIWIEPNKMNVVPRHETKHFLFPQNKLVPIASGKKNSDSIFIHQDATVSVGKFGREKKIDVTISKNHGMYIFVIEGKINVADESLERRDAIGVWDTEKVTIECVENSFVIVFDVPM